MNISSLPKYLRLTPFDTESEQGRSDERYRLALITMLANILSRGLSMLVMVFTVSLTMPYLGVERFGVWMTIASFVGVLSFMDLGVGNALTNRVAFMASKGSDLDLGRTISGGLGLLLLLGITMSAVLITLAHLIPWDILIKVQNISLNKEVNDSVLVFSGLFGLNIFTSGIQRVFAGLQRSFESHLVSSFGSIGVLLAMWVVTKDEASVPILLLVTFGGQSISSLVLIYVLFKRAQFKFSLVHSNLFSESRQLIRTGGTFLLLQLGCMLISGADSLIISSQLGAEHVAAFAIVMRLFQISTQPMSILNSPLWGAYADAHARNEKVFIRKTFKLSMMTSSIYSTSMMFLLVIFGERIVHLWTGSVIHISIGLLVVYGLWSIIDAVSNAFGVFLNGCGLLRPQIVTVLFFCTAGILAKIILIRLFGIEAMIFGAVLSYIFISFLVYGWMFRKELMRELR
jgi:O-antigen/teichoic acid export membrane protein